MLEIRFPSQLRILGGADDEGKTSNSIVIRALATDDIVNLIILWNMIAKPLPRSGKHQKKSSPLSLSIEKSREGTEIRGKGRIV